jgi:hypothetical protein
MAQILARRATPQTRGRMSRGRMKIDVVERALKTALGVSGNLLGVVLDKANLSVLWRYGADRDNTISIDATRGASIHFFCGRPWSAGRVNMLDEPSIALLRRKMSSQGIERTFR